MKKKEKKLIDENLFNLNEMCSLQKKVEWVEERWESTFTRILSKKIED